jgi:hypothetical protein
MITTSTRGKKERGDEKKEIRHAQMRNRDMDEATPPHYSFARLFMSEMGNEHLIYPSFCPPGCRFFAQPITSLPFLPWTELSVKVNN